MHKEATGAAPSAGGPFTGGDRWCESGLCGMVGPACGCSSMTYTEPWRCVRSPRQKPCIPKTPGASVYSDSLTHLVRRAHSNLRHNEVYWDLFACRGWSDPIWGRARRVGFWCFVRLWGLDGLWVVESTTVPGVGIGTGAGSAGRVLIRSLIKVSPTPRMPRETPASSTSYRVPGPCFCVRGEEYLVCPVPTLVRTATGGSRPGQ